MLSGDSPPNAEEARDEAYRRATALLRSVATSDGFVAFLTDYTNYHRVWSRDGIIIGLAALSSEDEALVEAFRRTLSTLARHQGPQGEIPSNVGRAGPTLSAASQTPPLWRYGRWLT